jgi:hypothetical protein
MNEPKKIARRLVLKETHPTAIKVAKLCDLASELGISLSFYRGRVLIEDSSRDKNLPPLYLEDIEEEHHFEGFPFETEYKLVYENPEWIAQEEKEHKERLVKEEENRRLEAERKQLAEQQAAEERAKALEARERRMLAELKEKYES